MVPKSILEGFGVLLGLLQMVLGLQGAPRDARGLILAPFWTNFGFILEQFLLSKMHNFQGCCLCCFWMRCVMDFGYILGQFWHDFWFHFNGFAELPE